VRENTSKEEERETKDEDGKAASPPEPVWLLHENLFKKSPNHVVNPDNLRKTSSQMFSVYKYYESPQLQVKSEYYTNSKEYGEVKDLVPRTHFFDAPIKIVEAAVAAE